MNKSVSIIIIVRLSCKTVYNNYCKTALLLLTLCIKHAVVFILNLVWLVIHAGVRRTLLNTLPTSLVGLTGQQRAWARDARLTVLIRELKFRPMSTAHWSLHWRQLSSCASRICKINRFCSNLLSVYLPSILPSRSGTLPRFIERLAISVCGRIGWSGEFYRPVVLRKINTKETPVLDRKLDCRFDWLTKSQSKLRLSFFSPLLILDQNLDCRYLRRYWYLHLNLDRRFLLRYWFCVEHSLFVDKRLSLQS